MRAFQISLLIIAFLPFALGVWTLIVGAGRYLDPNLVTATLDNQMRYSAVLSMMPFALAIWIVRNMDVAGPVLVVVIGVIAVAGLARLISVLQFGWPDVPLIIGSLVEISSLIFIPWFYAVTGKAFKLAGVS